MSDKLKPCPACDGEMEDADTNVIHRGDAPCKFRLPLDPTPAVRWNALVSRIELNVCRAFVERVMKELPVSLLNQAAVRMHLDTELKRMENNQ